MSDLNLSTESTLDSIKQNLSVLDELCVSHEQFVLSAHALSGYDQTRELSNDLMELIHRQSKDINKVILEMNCQFTKMQNA